MPICSSCTAELRPEWKFCITCGRAVQRAHVEPNPVSSAALAALLDAVQPETQPSATVAPALERVPAPEPEPEPEVGLNPEPELAPPVSRLRTTAAYYAPLAFSLACFLAAGGVVTWLAINVWF